MRVRTLQDFITKATEVHESRYTYNNFVYKASRIKSFITCPDHGDFEQDAFNHLQGKGCSLCAREKTRQASIKGKDFYLNKARLVHGEAYDYSKVESYKVKDHVTIICLTHGPFRQTWDKHIHDKHGCPGCGNVKKVRNRKDLFGYTKQDFILAAERNGRAILYIIRCYNEHESFYKIGITTQKTVKRRFHSKAGMPYQYEIIQTIKGTGEEVWNLEKMYHKKLKQSKYTPIIPFSGSSTECFTTLPY